MLDRQLYNLVLVQLCPAHHVESRNFLIPPRHHIQLIMAPSVLENMKATTEAQFDAYRSWNVDAILEPRTEDCIYRFLPETLQRPPMNNSDYRAYFSTIIPLLQDFNVRKF